MSVAALPGVPRPHAWRARLRRTRRHHRTRALGETLTNLYILLWIVVVYGGALLSSARAHLRAVAGSSGVLAAHGWLTVAALLAAAGLAWQAMQAVGPLVATPAEQAWGLSTPIERRGWLLPRFVATMLGSAVAGAAAAVVGSMLGFAAHALATSALSGAVLGIAGSAMGVSAQGAPDRRRWPSTVGPGLLSAAALGAAFVVIAHPVGRVPLATAARLNLLLLAIGLPLAVAWVTAAFRALPRLDVAVLGSGVSVVAAAMTAAIWLDPSLMARVLEVRHWRRVGRVQSRRLTSILPGRAGVLLQAELWRQTRRPRALAVWAALVLVHYAVATVAPALAGVSQVIGAYLAAGRLCGGLRTVARSSALRRALGGGELAIRFVHLVVPALGAALWWALTIPAGGARAAAAPVLVAGVVAAAYRGATRPPMTYGAPAFDTPLGALPVEIVLQLARGWDLLGVTLVLQVILTR